MNDRERVEKILRMLGINGEYDEGRDYVVTQLAEVRQEAIAETWEKIAEYFKPAEEAFGISGFVSNAIAKAQLFTQPKGEKG